MSLLLPMKPAVQTGPLDVPLLPVVPLPVVVPPVVLLPPLLAEPPPPPPQESSSDDTRTTPNIRNNMAFPSFKRSSFSHAKLTASPFETIAYSYAICSKLVSNATRHTVCSSGALVTHDRDFSHLTGIDMPDGCVSSRQSVRAQANFRTSPAPTRLLTQRP